MKNEILMATLSVIPNIHSNYNHLIHIIGRRMVRWYLNITKIYPSDIMRVRLKRTFEPAI